MFVNIVPGKTPIPTLTLINRVPLELPGTPPISQLLPTVGGTPEPSHAVPISKVSLSQKLIAAPAPRFV